jgi:hypothetical protein
VNDSGKQVASSIDEILCRAAWLMMNISRVQCLILRASSIIIHKIISLFGPVDPNISKVDVQLMHILGGFPSIVKFAPNVRWLVSQYKGIFTHWLCLSQHPPKLTPPFSASKCPSSSTLQPLTAPRPAQASMAKTTCSSSLMNLR